jgi:hypothetical protein
MVKYIYAKVVYFHDVSFNFSKPVVLIELNFVLGVIFQVKLTIWNSLQFSTNSSFVSSWKKKQTTRLFQLPT